MTESFIVGAHWRKSSRSGGEGTNCVEAAARVTGPGVAARDSKDPDGPVLAFTPSGWASLLSEIKRGALDLA
ncbi:DUF397 domain-containing protein [Actinomadura macrotermitis]|uniref:DUF397 domain-containing protein n=1 Tax=Actinomadura macrotermitis TaxID=2585200 RepID=A0A7K0C505_9ACTN|nr:DUF397 domain-containing protein [Actinomadura macrotermitis]MQY08519.1 hypothetical protein [Actinomadura macrotermitis]